ncbi:hypothetical protein [Nocardiopsis synnemataformans]|uniref:phage tail protein n=1 Tax=Nocardiopsis synnemataformans TaxID=61305 RepID=UPI003EBCE433
MTVLATAAVEVIAETDGFDEDLRRKIHDASASADRASRDSGRRIGTIMGGAAVAAVLVSARQINRALTGIGRGAQRAFTAAQRSLDRFRAGFEDAEVAASALSGRMGTLGGAARRALTTTVVLAERAANALGRVRDGFISAEVAASAFSGRLGTLGGQIRRALNPGIALIEQFSNGLGRVRDGFMNADAAASAFSGRLGTLGGQIRRALEPALVLPRQITEGLGRVRDGFMNADAAASVFSGRLGTLGGVARRALNPLFDLTQRAADGLGRVRDGFVSADAAASAFSGRLGTVGGTARRALDAVTNGLGRVRDGYLDANAAASAFSGRLGTLGGIARRATDNLSSTFTFLTGNNFAGSQRLIVGLGGALGDVATTARRLVGGLGVVAKAFTLAATSAALFSGATALMLTTLPALGAWLGSISAGILGGGIATIGIVAAAQAEQVQTAFSNMASHVGEVMTGVAGPIERSLVALANDLTGLFDSWAPSFEAGFVALGPALTTFFSDVTGSARSLGPAFQAGSEAFAEMLGVLGPRLGASLERLSVAMQELFAAADHDGFANLVAGIFNVTAALLELFTRATLAQDGISRDLAPALEALTPLWEGFTGGLSTAASALGEFSRRYLREVSNGIVAATPLLEDFGAGFAMAGDFIASLLDDLTPLLGAIEPFVEGFVIGFTEARETIVDFASALLERLGFAEGSLREFATWLGENEELVRTLGIAVGSIVAIFGTYRLVALGVALANTLLSKSFTAIALGIRSIPVVGWIITALGLLALGIQQLWQRSETFRDVVTSAWSRITGVFEDGGDRIGEVLTAFREGWDRLVVAAQGDGGIATAWEALQDAASTAWGVLEPIFDQIGESWNFLLDLITGDRSLSDAGDLVGSYFSNLSDIGENIGGFLIRQLERVPSIVLDGLDWVGETFGPWLVEQLKKLPGYALDGLRVLGDTVGEWFEGLPGRIETALGVTDGWGQWFSDLASVAVERLQELGETIAEHIQRIPGIVRERIGDGAAILAWLRELPPKIAGFMVDYGPQILRGLAIAATVVALGIPALLLGLLASILLVLGVIAWELIKWAHESFTNMALAAGQAIGEGINRIVLWFQALPGRVLAAVLNFGAQLYVWGTTALAQLRLSFTQGLANLLGSWTSTWTNLRTNAETTWSHIVTWATTQAQNLYTRVMTPVDSLRRAVIAAFDAARAGVAVAWGKLRSAVGEPIEWVVNTAYNDWLRGVWGKVVDKFDGPALPSYTVAFAKGGIFPGNGGGVFSGYTPGRDVHAMPMAAFSGGESVLRPEVTRAWGPKTTLMLNKLAQSGGVAAVRRALAMLFAGQNPFTGMSVPRVAPAAGGGGFAQRFARGGILGNVTGPLSGVASWLNSAKDDFGEGMFAFLEDPSGTLRRLLDQIMDYKQMPGWGSTWTSQLAKIPKGMVDILVKEAGNLFSLDGIGDWANFGGSVGGRIGAAIAFARAQQGKPYIWGGVGPAGYDCSGIVSAVHNVLLGQTPYRRRYTTHPFTGRSYGGYIRNLPSPLMVGVTHANVGHMSGTLAGKYNFESRGSRGAVFGPAARGWNNSLYSHRYGLAAMGRIRNSRMGGEGLLYDGGGTLWPGTYLVSNKTGKPESIRTYAQEERVSRLVRAVEHQSAQVARSPLVPIDQIGALQRALGVRGRDTDTDDRPRVYAPITVNTVASDPQQIAVRVVDRLVQQSGV